MAGKGFAPNLDKKGPAPLRVYTNDEPQPVDTPSLPEIAGFEWPEATRVWWDTWCKEPMVKDWRPTDWQFLQDTALLHAAVYQGDLKQAAELRLRCAKMGQTQEDRARLRIQYADADMKDVRASQAATGTAKVSAGKTPGELAKERRMRRALG